ncbi:unnamed protein product, partial [Musa acuminata subsp. malaccensis]
MLISRWQSTRQILAQLILSLISIIVCCHRIVACDSHHVHGTKASH